MGLIVALDLDGTFHQTGVETILYLYKENRAYYRCFSMAAFVLRSKKSKTNWKQR